MLVYKKKLAKKDKNAIKISNEKKRSSTDVGKDLVMFILVGLLILLAAQMKDAYHFLSSIYRSDVKEYATGSSGDYIMTEEQFERVKLFFEDQMSKLVSGESFGDNNGFIGTKDLVLSLKERFGITQEIYKLLFNPDGL